MANKNPAPRPIRQRPIPRGIRNCNPLNIRIGNVWLGEVSSPDDPEFEQFVSMLYGLRAAFVLMRRYICHYHRTTIPAIIAAWAPSIENNTAKYIDIVCSRSGITPDATLSFDDKVTICRMVQAMAFVETGQELTMQQFEKAYDLA